MLVSIRYALASRESTFLWDVSCGKARLERTEARRRSLSVS
jgi:hypothetical protein